MTGAARHQFTTLDGLRGIAVLSVMAFHRRAWFGEWAFMNHAPLAVDFFFLLSGLVIAHAYDGKLGQAGGGRRFVRDRLVRLHPMLVFGALLAGLVVLLESRAEHVPLRGDAPWLLLAHLAPFPAFWTDQDAAFPWNIAIWSLFWELIVNLVYVAAFRFLTLARLTVVVIVSIAAMFVVAAGHDGFQVGFARDPGVLLLGFPRVCASFFLGVLIRRTVPLAPRHGRWPGAVCGALLLLSFCAPPLGPAASALYDPLIAYVLYPILLVLAATSAPVSRRACVFLGLVSYPLYVIHEPALKVLGGLLRTARLSDGSPNLPEAIARLCAVAVGSFLVLRLYDEPCRRLLRRLLDARTRAGAGAAAR